MKASLDKAIEFLKTRQNEDGSFAPKLGGPGITGLIVAGLIRNGVNPDEPVVAKAMAYLEKQVKPDGSSVDLYGVSPLGQLIYDAEGHMSVHLLMPDLPKCGTQDRRKCSDAAARAAFDNYLGYWGHYQVSPDGKTVVHTIEGASAPDWIGTSQARFFELKDGTLTLTTPIQTIGGVQSKAVLVWVRQR